MHDISDFLIRPRKNDCFVLSCPSKHIIMTALGETFHKHFDGLAYLALIGFKRELVLQRNNLIQSADFLFFRYVIRQMFKRVGSRSFGLLKHKRSIKAHLAHETKRLGMIFQRLIMESAEYIRADGSIG